MNQALSRLAQTTGEAGDLAEPRRQHCLDAGANQPGEHRRVALGGNGNAQRRAIDDGGRVEITFGGHIDDIQRNATSAGLGLGAIGVLALFGNE